MMTKLSISEVLNEQCPNGVDFVKLKDIATVSGAGVDKKIIPGEKSVILLNYMDIFKNGYLDKSIPTMEVTASDRKIEQCSVLKGDIFFTPTSENIEEIGIAAVSTEDMMGVVYSYHIMRIRLNRANYTTSQFIRYMFESEVVRRQIEKYAKGITRYGLTKTQWEQIEIPLPPLPVQEEIVRILDTFTELIAELKAELTARKKQYEFYREQLLGFEGRTDVEWKSIGDVATYHRGLTYSKESEVTSGGIRVLRANNIDVGSNTLNFKDVKRVSSKVKVRADQRLYKGDILICSASGSKAHVGKVAYVTEDLDYYFGGFMAAVRSKDSVSSRYLYHLLASSWFTKHLEKELDGSTINNIKATLVYSCRVPIPSLAEQERIVSILDQFDTLTNSLTEGIPAEIELRQKQYEFYREKLLTFERRHVSYDK